MIYRSNAKTQMDLIYFNYLPHLLHGCSRTLHFALLKLGLPKLLLFLSSNRKKQRKCCSNRNFINSNNIDSNQVKTRKQEEQGSFWTKGKDTRRTSGGKQLKCKLSRSAFLDSRLQTFSPRRILLLEFFQKGPALMR